MEPTTEHQGMARLDLANAGRAHANGHHPAPRRRWARRHPVATLLVVSLVVLAGWTLAAGMVLLGAREAMVDGRTELNRARAAARQLDLEGVESHLRTGGVRFADAERRLGGTVLAPARALPLLGSNVTGSRVAAAVAGDVTDAVAEVLAAVSAQPGGLGTFAPSRGRIPIESYAELAGDVAGLQQRLAAALARVDEALQAPLLPVVESGLLELRDEAREVERTAAVAAAGLEALPAFLGADGPRRYFFGAGNPAELRGVGGFLGAFSIVTVDDGRVSFGDFRSIARLEDLPIEDIPAPNPDYAARYDRYGGAGFWRNINITPDFPSAGQAITTLYERTEGVRLDGVVTADPLALQQLAMVTGPVTVPELGRVRPRDIAAVLANEAVEAFEDGHVRKEVLGAVAADILAEFLQGGDDPVDSARALASATGGGNILLYATDEALQSRLVDAGVGGDLYQGESDYLHVVGIDGAANKADFYMDRTVSYDAVLDPGGQLLARATVELDNHAPTEGEPSWVIGPNYADFVAGENATFLNVFCGDCAIHRFTRNGVAMPVRAEQELGRPVFWSYERQPSGEQVAVVYDWAVPGGWAPDGRLSTYRLVVDGQVTMRPTAFRLSVTPPAGMEVVSAAPQMATDGSRLVWEGDLGRRQVFEVTFRPEGNPARRALTGWWNRPLLGD